MNSLLYWWEVFGGICWWKSFGGIFWMEIFDRNFWCKFYGGKYLVEMPISEVSKNLDFGKSSR